MHIYIYKLLKCISKLVSLSASVPVGNKCKTAFVSRIFTYDVIMTAMKRVCRSWHLKLLLL